MWTSSRVQKDMRITHLNHWPKNLINKCIHYKSNILSTFFWLELALAPALDIFHSVLPCLVMMYHQTNLDCKSFSISEDLVEMIVALTLNIAKWYFWMILWLMMMHHHTKFDGSEILSRQTFAEVQNLHCYLDLEYSKATFSQDTPAYEHALSKKINSSEHMIEIIIFDCMNRNLLLWPWPWR